MAAIRGTQCMVRIGGGFEKLEDYITKNKDSEMDKIKRIMNE